MMSSYVCRQCRTRLLQRKLHRPNPQFQTRATFVSFQNRGTAPEKHGERSENEPAQQKGGDRHKDSDNNGNHDNQWNQEPGSFTIRTHLSRNVPALDSSGRLLRKGRYSKYVPTASTDQLPDIESFETTASPRAEPLATYRPLLNQSRSQTQSKADNITKRSPDAGSTIPHSSRIGDMLKAGEIDQAWALFEKEYPLEMRAAHQPCADLPANTRIIVSLGFVATRSFDILT